MTDISIAGSLYVGPYKGYHGKAEFDAESGSFHGSVTDTRDVITFVGDAPQGVSEAFKDSVDDYLDFCKETGTNPEKPFSGNFMVRATPALHRTLSVRAEQMGLSLNQLVVNVLESNTSPGLSVSLTGRVSQFADSPILEGSDSTLANYHRFAPSTRTFQFGAIVTREASDQLAAVG